MQKVDPDGTATMSFRFEQLSGRFDGQPVTFDAAQAHEIQLVISPDGRIVSGGTNGSAGGKQTNSVPGGDQFSSILPTHDVKAGDSWGVSFDRPNPVGSGTMHYTTVNTFLRYDDLDNRKMAVLHTNYSLPIDVLLDIRQLLALTGDDPGAFPAASAISYKGHESGEMTSFVDVASHQLTKADDLSDFDFAMSFQGLPAGPQFAPLGGSFHFTGRQNASLRKL